MNRLGAILGSIVFLFVAPGIVAGVIPWAISQYRMDAPLLGFDPLRWIGGLLLLLGAMLLLETFARFALPNAGAGIRQLHGRPGEVWLPESGTERIAVIRDA